MAKVIGGITTSHIPSVGNALADPEKRNDPYWKRFFDGYEPAREWLEENKPDIAIVVYNDHGLNFFLNMVPTMAIGCASEYKNADEGWALPQKETFQGDAQLSWHIAESLIEQEFDMTTCQEMLVDHGFTVPMQLLWGHLDEYPVDVLEKYEAGLYTFVEDRYPQIFSELKEKEEISDDLDKVMAEAMNAYGEEFSDTIK